MFLAEGPWPAKAYYDARQRARQRDAGHFMNYGFTRPGVFSRGPFPQRVGERGIFAAPPDEAQQPTPAAPQEEPDAAEPVPLGEPEMEDQTRYGPRRGHRSALSASLRQPAAVRAEFSSTQTPDLDNIDNQQQVLGDGQRPAADHADRVIPAAVWQRK